MLTDVSSIVIAFWRLTLGSVFLWLLFPFFKRETRNTQDYKIIFAGIILAFHFIFFFKALKLTTIANATLFGTMAPLFSILYEQIFKKQSLHLNVYLGLSICLLGSILIHYESIALGFDHILGNFYAIICSFLLAITYNLGKNVRTTISTYYYTRTLFSSASLTLFCIMLFQNNSFFDYNLNEYLIFILLGIIPTILGHGILSYLLKFFPTTIVISVPLGEPVIASFLGFLVFQETISVVVFFCAVLILTGLYFIIQNTQK